MTTRRLLMPVPSFLGSADLLADRELVTQRMLAWQTTGYLIFNQWDKSEGVVDNGSLWRGHEIALCQWGITLGYEWENRGHHDSLRAYFRDNRDMFGILGASESMPPWFGDAMTHNKYCDILRSLDSDKYNNNQWEDRLKYWVQGSY